MRLLALAAVAALLASPVLAAPAKGPTKMGACAAKWTAMNSSDKGRYNDKAKGMKSKKGNSLSGYNVWTGECMKKG